MSLPARAEVSSRVPVARRLADYVSLARPALTGLVVLMAASGYALCAAWPLEWGGLLQLAGAVGLLSAGASALNQYIERRADGLMERTRDRPLPAGRMAPVEALAFGALCCAAGAAWLYLVGAGGPLAAALALGGALFYIFAYTPLKSRTTLNTLIGAVPGALPPVIGWAAAEGGLSAGAGALFVILFVWQIPHFYAIAWIHRGDYARAGMRMISVVDDPDGARTMRQIVLWCLVLLPASLLPAMAHVTGWRCMAVAVVLGAVMLGMAAALARVRTRSRARLLFLASIIYLPCLFAAMMFDRL